MYAREPSVSRDVRQVKESAFILQARNNFRGSGRTSGELQRLVTTVPSGPLEAVCPRLLSQLVKKFLVLLVAKSARAGRPALSTT